MLVGVWKRHIDRTFVKVFENVQLISVDSAFDVSIERSVLNALRGDRLVEKEVLPGDNHEENQQRNQ